MTIATKRWARLAAAALLVFSGVFALLVAQILSEHYSCANRSRVPPIPPFKTRADLGAMLEAEGLTHGVELGVQRGLFAEQTLKKWPSCRRYVLVDLWQHQANYADQANLNNERQEAHRKEALRRVAPFGDVIRVCRNYTTVCARTYAGQQFDFIYVDARHDYKGVLMDLRDWWPLLRPGGILAGHDYVTNDDGPRQTGQNWAINFDGTRDPSARAVKGAVDDFARVHGLHLAVGYRESAWNSWAARKPLDA